MLTKGNTKLGKIWNWSIPAIDTCPGSTDLCRSLCYACRGAYRFQSVQKHEKRNYELSRTAQFVPIINGLIKQWRVDILRIHASGDFYNTSYTRRWRRIIEASPDTQFYAYTRSWNLKAHSDKSLVTELMRLSRLPNMRLWLSCDSQTGRPPVWRRSPWAYLAISDEDTPRYPVDLIFRNKPETPAKRMGEHQSLVCPYEQAIERQDSITCRSCGLCFDARRRVLSLHDKHNRRATRAAAVAAIG